MRTRHAMSDGLPALATRNSAPFLAPRLQTKEQEKRVQEMRDTYLRRVEERLKEKEAQLMSV